MDLPFVYLMYPDFLEFIYVCCFFFFYSINMASGMKKGTVLVPSFPFLFKIYSFILCSLFYVFFLGFTIPYTVTTFLFIVHILNFSEVQLSELPQYCLLNSIFLHDVKHFLCVYLPLFVLQNKTEKIIKLKCFVNAYSWTFTSVSDVVFESIYKFLCCRCCVW